MAANEPKVTKLKPGEGAGDFQPKQGGGGKFKRGTPKGQKRTENPCILSDGSVDPQCKKVYQRSVAGRQTMEQFISEKAAQGMTEKDIFMAAVNGLMTRKLGYVGAYLDSKNPGRTYNQNQAYKIADAVMTKMGVGDNPGARLTGPSGGGRQRGKAQEKGKAGSSVGQQRKKPEGRGGGFGMPETWAKPGEKAPSRPVEKPEPKAPKASPAPQTEIQRTLEQVRSGKMSKEDLSALLQQKREGGKIEAPALPGSQAAAQRDKAIEAGKEKEAKKQRPPVESKQPSPVEEKPATPEEVQLPAKEEESTAPTQLQATDEQITNVFRQKYKEYLNSAFEQAKYDARKFKRVAPEKSQIKLSDEEIADAAQEAIDDIAETSQIDKNKAIEAINRKFKLNIQPEQEQEPSAPPKVAEEPSLEREAPAPERENPPLQKGQLKGKTAADIDTNTLSVDDSMRLLDYKLAMRRLREGRPMTVGQSDGYEWGVSMGLPDSPEEEDKVLSNKAQPTQEKETEPDPWEGEPSRRVDPTRVEQTPAPGPAALPPARSPRPVASKGGFRAEAARAGAGGRGPRPKGFTPGPAKAKIKDALAKAKSEGKTPQQVVEEYRQGSLFPGGLVTDTPETKPLEGGNTPEPAPPEETPARQEAESGNLLDEEGKAKDFRKSGPKKPESRQPASSRQIPLPLGRGVSAATLRGRANLEKQRVEQELKKVPKGKTTSRRKGKAPQQQELFTKGGRPRKFNSSEYQEFADAVRQVVKVRSAEAVA